MFDRAVAALKADKATALAEFNDKNNKQFHDRDLYVFCFNMSDGKLTAEVDQAVMGATSHFESRRTIPSGKEDTTY